MWQVGYSVKSEMKVTETIVITVADFYNFKIVISVNVFDLELTFPSVIFVHP